MANATGFKVRSRGMSRGLEYNGDVMQIGKLYDIDELRALGGIVDYVVGTPLTKVYVLAEHPDPKQQHYLNLYKMGEGPLYSFFIPYHLVHFEVPNSIARVVLFRDNLAPPLGGPVVEVCAVAKRDLKAGEILDDYGMYMTYGEAANVDEMSAGQYLPEGLVEGCKLVRDVAKDAVLTYDDVELPPGRLADRLRAEQYRHFRGRDVARVYSLAFARMRQREACTRSNQLFDRVARDRAGADNHCDEQGRRRLDAFRQPALGLARTRALHANLLSHELVNLRDTDVPSLPAGPSRILDIDQMGPRRGESPWS